MEENNPDNMASPSTPGAAKSKLDTLSKEDLIKFSKKQMVVLQKLKSKCADLEKEVGELKAKSNSGADDTIIQELTERMDAVLLEKAETQQKLVLLRKENEKAKQEAKEVLEKFTQLQEQSDRSNEEHLQNVVVLKKELDAVRSQHQEEVEGLQQLLKESRKDRESQQGEAEEIKAHLELVRQDYEERLSVLQRQLGLADEERVKELDGLREAHDAELAESRQEVENLYAEMSKIREAHQEEARMLMEQLEASAAEYEAERDRLLVIQEALTEQLAQHDGSLQDVQEEEEETGPAGVQNHTASPASGGQQEDEADRLKLLVADLQAQQTMLQDELTYVGNEKSRLESELQQARDEFLLEREELEFKINELQMSQEDSEGVASTCREKLQVTNEHWEMALNQHEQELSILKEKHQVELKALEQNLTSATATDLEKRLQETLKLKERCDQLASERNEAVHNYEQTKEILRNLESELADRTAEFVKQYNAMKDQGASAVHELQQKLRAAFNEKDGLLERIQSLEAQVEKCQQDDSEELRSALSNAQQKNKEMLALLHRNESTVQELQESVTQLTREKEDTLLRLKDSECLRETHSLEGDRASELQQSLEDVSRVNAELLQKQQEAEASLEVALAENKRISHQLDVLDGRLAEAGLDKERQSSDLKALAEELSELKKTKDCLQEEIGVLRSERVSESHRERGELETSLQSVSEERERLRQGLEEKEQQLSLSRQQIVSVFQREASLGPLEEAKLATKDISELVHELLAKVLEEKKSLLLQSDEKIARLYDDIERIREESGQQRAELQSLVDDQSKERTMLKENLEEVVADTEALQRDLLQMKDVNEKMKEENGQLLAQLAEASEKLREKESERVDLGGKSEKLAMENLGEKEQLQQLLMERESLASRLQKDIDDLKESKEVSTAEDTKVTELSDKIAALERESREKDEKMHKIKAVAVKAKKELDNSRKEVKSLKEEVESCKAERDRLSGSMKDIIQGAEGYKNLQAEYDKLSEVLDRERERAEAGERQVGELTKRLQAAAVQQDQLTSEREDLVARMDTLHSNVKQLEGQVSEALRVKSGLEKELEGERLLKEQKIKDHSAAAREIEDLQKAQQKQRQQMQETMQELELLRKDAQQNTLMGMEMADYERLVKELNQKIAEQERRVGELEEEIHAQRTRQEVLLEEISSLKSLVDQGEEKNSKMKQLLVKTKKDLADTKKSEADQMVLQASLRGKLEASQQQLEEHKIQSAELAAERHRLQEQLRSLTEQHQRAAGSFQQRLGALQEECSSAKAELATTVSEFEGYKVRVHNVLKQQKNKSATHTENEATKPERELLERTVEQLRGRLQETQLSLQGSNAELQQLQTEHDALLERHNKILQESVSKEAELREKLGSLQAENVLLRSEHAQTLSQLTAQNDALRGGFQEQIRRLQEEHGCTVETLQAQVGRLEAQLFQLQREPSATSPAPAQQQRKMLQERKAADLPLFELQSMAREEGEGMETTESESVSSAGTHLPSLEQLLNSPEPKTEPFVWQAEPSKEELSQNLSTANKSIEHLSGLLHETEATNAILMEQITLLKSEVRRLERNQEREKSVANLEYLKNVLLQFIFLKSGSERQALLPVIHTMLQLSPEEKGRLAAIAQGEEEAAGASRSSGWTSYLHSWSGIR
ncbi:GRIP and coiled-coil domain-containing protein 2 isoform X2 [Amia ocellicauda]|uniref:GRIP and coiled-coil domain-containing protein 2 isoform X2 n=1 Tax=Amia ocellicauda TaxID=2972642 RepID=UPI0034649D9A